MIRVAQKAINALTKANTLNPAADEVWIAMVRLLVEVGQPDKAPALIERAKRSLTGEQAAITLATCYEMLQQMGKARSWPRPSTRQAAKAAPKTLASCGKSRPSIFAPRSTARPNRCSTRSSPWRRPPPSPIRAGPAATWPTSCRVAETSRISARPGPDRGEPAGSGLAGRQVRAGCSSWLPIPARRSWARPSRPWQTSSRALTPCPTTSSTWPSFI